MARVLRIFRFVSKLNRIKEGSDESCTKSEKFPSEETISVLNRSRHRLNWKGLIKDEKEEADTHIMGSFPYNTGMVITFEFSGFQ